MALNPNRMVLKSNRDTDEWVVKVYIDGKYSDEHSYYTDDKADAEATMASMKASSWAAGRFGGGMLGGLMPGCGKR